MLKPYNISLNTRKHAKRQAGTVIVIALIFLLLTGLISVSAMKTSIFETKMASNEQLKEEAFQTAQGVVNAVTSDINNFVIAGDVGYKICKTGAAGCDSNTIALAATTSTLTAKNVDYHITRKAPLFAPIPFRASEQNASSAKSYSAALFEVNAEYDGSQDRLGQAAIAQGVAIKVANAGQ
ncbi:MAG TPA: PilX N-terminal domain-containing pilus assembly protein [Marinagarivorans sp.]